MNFNAEQSFSTPFSVFRNASNQFCIMTFVPTSCKGHLPGGMECMYVVFFSEPKLCANKDVLIYDLYSAMRDWATCTILIDA